MIPDTSGQDRAITPARSALSLRIAAGSRARWRSSCLPLALFGLALVGRRGERLAPSHRAR
jgi:hypothetical protein